MDFDWMTPTRVPTKRGFDAMYLDELRDQARLLQRLGFTADQATERLRGNIRWEFDPEAPRGALPGFYESIDALITEIYDTSRGG